MAFAFFFLRHASIPINYNIYWLPSQYSCFTYNVSHNRFGEFFQLCNEREILVEHSYLHTLELSTLFVIGSFSEMLNLFEKVVNLQGN